eukprot:2534611-Pleurochrysis_carterae.AAC.2
MKRLTLVRERSTRSGVHRLSAVSAQRMGPAFLDRIRPLGPRVLCTQAMKEHPEDALPLAALQCLVLAGSFLGLASASSGILPWELPWHELLPDGGMAALQLPAVLDADSIAQLTATWTVPIAVAYTGLITTALTIWLQAAVFKRLPAVDASVVLTTEPLWACLCGAPSHPSLVALKVNVTSVALHVPLSGPGSHNTLS